MIGDQPTGTIEGVRITAVAHEGLSVLLGTGRGRLAVIDDEGRIIVAGDQLATEVEAVAVNSYRNFLKGQGHLRVLSAPLAP